MFQKLGPALFGAVIGALVFWGMQKMVQPPPGAPPELRPAHVEIAAPTPVDEPRSTAENDPAAGTTDAVLTAGIRGQEAEDTGIRGVEAMGSMVAPPAGGAPAEPAAACVDRELAPKLLVAPDYPLVARRDGVEGQVEVEFTVDADGQVSGVTVVSATQGETFSAAALAAVHRWRFAPRTVGCEPVAARVRQALEFQLDDGD